MGVELRDSTYLLSPKNTRKLKSNMIFNLGLGFSDLVSESGQKYVLIRGKRGRSCLPLPSRYAIQLVDTIKIEAEKASLLTEGVKSTKDTMFFLNPESADEKPKKPEKKAPAVSRKNGSPPKKTVAGKVLRNNRRNDEAHVTVSAKLAEHQQELHGQLQAQGLEKYSEGGGGASGKEGKGWKKFQSYKGEGALPPDVDRLRVRCIKIS